MNTTTRRDFLWASAAAAVSVGRLAPAAPPPATGPFKTTLRKAMIVGAIEELQLQKLKDAGFDGVETTAIVTEDQAAKARELATKVGMRIHGVLRGWAEFNSTDPAKVAATLATTETALKAAGAYGATTVLLVPCRIAGMALPEPWEFVLEFDRATGHVTQVVAGDNQPYQAYIAAHNRAIDTSRVAVRKLIPTAAKAGVVIALENVWNNLWVGPEIYRHFVASFQSPWVQAYFDIGNHVKYVPPQEWIKTLGPLIAKCHVKDFQLNPDGHGGKFVHPRAGSIQWPAVRAALETVGYSGWLTIEDRGLPLEEFSRRLDLIIAGK